MILFMTLMVMLVLQHILILKLKLHISNMYESLHVIHSLVAQLVKNQPAIQEAPVWFLGQERSPGAGISYPLQYSWAFLVAQTVKKLPAMWETGVWSLGWKIPWRRAWQPTTVFLPGESCLAGYSPWGQRVGQDWAAKHSTILLKNNNCWEFSSSPVVRTPCFHCWGCSNPWSGN